MEWFLQDNFKAESSNIPLNIITAKLHIQQSYIHCTSVFLQSDSVLEVVLSRCFSSSGQERAHHHRGRTYKRGGGGGLDYSGLIFLTLYLNRHVNAQQLKLPSPIVDLNTPYCNSIKGLQNAFFSCEIGQSILKLWALKVTSKTNY